MSLISYDDALALILAHCTRRMPVETVPLVLASGRVLAGQPIVASENIPPRANSAMDGYAVIADDISSASMEHPVGLRVIGESAAGALFEGSVGHGEAVRIMTGGILPDGADAVIEVESTSESDGIVEVLRKVRVGESVRAAGEDIAEGEEVIPAGKRITPGDIGVLASLGVVNVPVRVKPKVGILSTGNEVVEPFRNPLPGQVRNSTGPALYAACAELGAEPIDLGIAGDDHEILEEKLEEGLRYDILLTTGGVSAGAYDLVQRILPELGVEVRFHKAAIRPGKPILFGTLGDGDRRTLVFGLPGNPVSTLITFGRFVAPAIRAMGLSGAAPLHLRATLEEPIAKNDDKRHFIRGILRDNPDGALVVSKTGTQSSGAMSSMSRANCVIILDEKTRSLDRGATVEVELL
jgi:molybdopterin molybdotransferase